MLYLCHSFSLMACVLFSVHDTLGQSTSIFVWGNGGVAALLDAVTSLANAPEVLTPLLVDNFPERGWEPGGSERYAYRLLRACLSSRRMVPSLCQPNLVSGCTISSDGSKLTLRPFQMKPVPFCPAAPEQKTLLALSSFRLGWQMASLRPPLALLISALP